jgi:uncharacterized SAM-binding protein YcdF (DUF218 family)
LLLAGFADTREPVTFWLSKIFWWFLAPGNAMVLLVLVALLLLAMRRRRAGLLVLGAVGAFGLALLFLPLRGWVLEPLEDRFPPAAAPAHVDGIIVLGGAINAELSAKRGLPVVTRSVDRLIAAADLARRYPDAKLVFTGGSSALLDTEPREADIAREVFAEMGLAPDRVIYERDSRNTWENALFSQKLVDPKPGEVWLLVTSAYHMPRAMGIFRKIGWQAVPYPVDYSVPPAGQLEPSLEVLDELEGVHWGLREWVGLVAYYLLGRTDRLFPGPAPQTNS